jgi:hydroxymethylglutaryl-CoA reductase
MDDRTTSRLAGFYRDPIHARVARLLDACDPGAQTRLHLERGGGLSVEVADRMSENVVAIHGLPLSVGLNFRVNGRDVIVPMAVEEPSVVAAASNAARLVRIRGGFHGEATAPVMTTQVHLDGVPDAAAAVAQIDAARTRIGEEADAAMPRMVSRGGGFRDLEVRVLDADEGMVVVHLYIDVGDAMGANIVDTVAEHVAPVLEGLSGGTACLRILSNLPMRRRVRVWAEIGDDGLGGAELAGNIVRASRFAELDPYRAVTHNKGILNGIDAAAVALGQDWRSIEAAAHGYAAIASADGRYRPLAVWTRLPDGIRGELELPLAVGTVGGATRVHDGVRAAFELLNVTSGAELAIVLASVGLASNLAALRALAGEGIQRGHMKLHQRKEELERRSGVCPSTLRMKS